MEKQSEGQSSLADRSQVEKGQITPDVVTPLSRGMTSKESSRGQKKRKGSQNQIIKSITSIGNDLNDKRPLTEEQFRKALKTQELGRPPVLTTRVNSGISVQNINSSDIERTKQLIILGGNHPLKIIDDPSTWRNVPPCVTNAITTIYKHAIQGDSTLFDYETKNNERLLKLQNAINKNKENQANFEQIIKAQLEKRVKIAEDRADSRMNKIENKLNDNAEKTLKNAIELKTSNIVNNKRFTIINETLEDLTKKLDKECEKTYQENIDINEKLVVGIYDLKQKMEDRLEIEIQEDDECKTYDIKTFLMDKLEKFGETELETQKKIKANEKRISDLIETIDSKITQNNTNLDVDGKLNKMSLLLKNITQEIDSTNKNLQSQNTIFEDFQKQQNIINKSNLSPSKTKEDEDEGPGASKGTTKIIKKMNEKIALINDYTLPQGLEKLEKTLTDKITMMSAKLDKKIKGVSKQFESQLENFSPDGTKEPSSPDAKSPKSESNHDDDDYTKLLIRQEIEEQLKDVYLKIGEKNQNTDTSVNTGAIATAPQLPLAAQSTDTNLRLDLEDLIDKVEKLQKSMKILELIVDSLPKKRAEDDPHFDEYEQYQNHVITEDKMRRNSKSPDRADIAAIKKKITDRLRSTIRDSVTRQPWKDQQSKEVNLTQTSKKVGSDADVMSTDIRVEESQMNSPLQIKNPVVKMLVTQPTLKTQFNTFNQSKKMIINTSFKGQTSVQHALAQQLNQDETSIQNQSSVVNLNSQRTRQSLQPDGVLRINPLTSRAIIEDDGFLSARNNQGNKTQRSLVSKNDSVRVSQGTGTSGLPQLTGNLRKKTNPNNVNKDAWGPNGTKFERIEGF